MSFVDLNLNSKSLTDLVDIVDSAYAASKDAHALVICTDWNDFKVVNVPAAGTESSCPTVRTEPFLFSSGIQDLDYDRMYSQMIKPAFVFDGRNVVDVERLQKIGFHVEKIGRQSSHQKIASVRS